MNVEADDPRVLAAFWAQLLGGTPEGGAGGFVFLAAREPGGFAMFFQPRTGPRPERRVSISTSPCRGDPASRRSIGPSRLGATHRWDVLDEVPWVQWSTLADPEGNLFCIAEHPPTR